jgi:hypothetical protein
MSGLLAGTNPFPGLRPFREGEEALFFGREAQVDAMVDKLAAARFLAVVGTSGSGKSSLVNCGLVPALHRGLMAGGALAWRVATLRPGNRPLRALAEALASPRVLGPQPDDNAGGDDGADFTPTELIESTLRMGKLGVVDAFEQAHLPAGQNLLIVVDQFEELFRYQALAGSTVAASAARSSEDATAFVNLLLEVCAHRELPIFVVLTMRSDFLGDCAQFFGLPEAINSGQYLVPRMSRDERRSAIAGPLRLGGAEIDPVLLTRLVNDVGDNPDQLSILQHALNRTWARWQRDGGGGALSLSHYEAVGAMALALNQHAEEAFAQIAEGRPRVLVEALFKAITDQVSDARGTRRPTRLDSLCAICAASEAELGALIEAFRDPEKSFLMPPAGTPLRADTPIDIAHESLMRVWDRLRRWGEAEARAVQTFRRLAETAELHSAGGAGLLRQPDLQFALAGLAREQPNAAWAARYRVGFDAMQAFVTRSEQVDADERRAEADRSAAQARLEHRQQRTRRIWRVVIPVIALLSALVVLSLYLLLESRSANQKFQVEARNSQAAASAAQIALENALAADRDRQQQAQVYAEATRYSPELRKVINQAQQDVQAKSLVYLQYADPSQKGLAERLRVQLGQKGYSAPGTEMVGVALKSSDLRYFRSDDAAKAQALAALLKTWNWSELQVKAVKGYEAKTQLQQFEVWLAAPDRAEIVRLLEQINAPSRNERSPASDGLIAGYAASPLAIAETLALLRPGKSEPLTISGRINALRFLSRTAPLAWDPALEAQGREVIARVSMGAEDTGPMSQFARLLGQLLDAVKAGDAAAPLANRGS